MSIIVSASSGCGSEQGILLQTTSAPATHPDFTIPSKPAITGTTPATTPVNSGARQADRLLAALDINREFGFLNTLAGDDYQGRRTGSAGGRAAASYIASQFSSLDLQPWSVLGLTSYTHHFIESGLESDNIVGVLPGSANDGSYILLAAHYDHLGLNGSGQAYNGADDNAAGVAAVLEAANIFHKTGIKPNRNIVFCAFSGEEEGQLGSSALGRLIANAGLAGNVEMINIDGIGATGGSYFGVWDEGFAGAAPLVSALKQAGEQLETPIREEGTDIGSDAQSFDWQYSIPAVTVDWSWGSDPSVWHPYYHTIHDDADQINQPVLERATRVALLGLWLRAM